MTDTKTPSPSDAELKALLPTKQLERGKDPKIQVWLTQGDALAFARAVLARWGQPQAVAGGEPVATSATGGDWEKPTTVLQRLGDSIQLLCAGKRPADAVLSAWLDHTSEELQEFCANHGPAWCQGIALIDAAMQMVEQPTEITTITHPDRDHEHRAARAAPQPATADAVDAYLEAQDALDNREYMGVNAEPHEKLMRRRNQARAYLDAALAAQREVKP